MKRIIRYERYSNKRDPIKRAARLGKKMAKKLRERATPEEIHCMNLLGLLGIGYEFQQNFIMSSRPRFRIVDFLIPDLMLVLEIDGAHHFWASGRKRDAIRAAQFASDYPHIRFIRFTNREVMASGFFFRLREVLCGAQPEGDSSEPTRGDSEGGRGVQDCERDEAGNAVLEGVGQDAVWKERQGGDIAD